MSIRIPAQHYVNEQEPWRMDKYVNIRSGGSTSSKKALFHFSEVYKEKVVNFDSFIFLFIICLVF